MCCWLCGWSCRAIAQLFPALCHLRQCQLSLCAALDDIALTHLAAGASLTTLDLRGCWKITDAGDDRVQMQQHAAGWAPGLMVKSAAST